MAKDAAFTVLQRLKCLLTIIFLICSVPISITYAIVITISSFTSGSSKRKRKPITEHSKTVMITGGKMSTSLHFARSFWSCGYKVVMIETNEYRYIGSKWSRAVTYFETISCPRMDSEKYMDDLVRVAKKYNAHYFVPVSSPVSTRHDSAIKPKLEELSCRVLHFDLEMIEILDNKHKFCNYMKEIDLNGPRTFLVKSDGDAKALNETLAENKGGTDVKCILKNNEYDPMHRLDFFTLPCDLDDLDSYLKQIRHDGNGITHNSPWQVQQYIEGRAYMCMVVLYEGNVRAITTCQTSPTEPPNYKHIDIPAINEWVAQFAEKTGITGQLCFEVIRTDRDILYPTECNPRVHSICSNFLGSSEFGDAVLSDEWSERPLMPTPHTPPVFWLYNELFKLIHNTFFNYRKAKNKQFRSNIVELLKYGQESDFDVQDPIPFFMRNHVQIPLFLWDTLRNGRPWIKVDFCSGKIE